MGTGKELGLGPGAMGQGLGAGRMGKELGLEKGIGLMEEHRKEMQRLKSADVVGIHSELVYLWRVTVAIAGLYSR